MENGIISARTGSKIKTAWFMLKGSYLDLILVISSGTFFAFMIAFFTLVPGNSMKTVAEALMLKDIWEFVGPTLVFILPLSFMMIYSTYRLCRNYFSKTGNNNEQHYQMLSIVGVCSSALGLLGTYLGIYQCLSGVDASLPFQEMFIRFKSGVSSALGSTLYGSGQGLIAWVIAVIFKKFLFKEKEADEKLVEKFETLDNKTSNKEYAAEKRSEFRLEVENIQN
jgi:membrane protein implicated in regulation of membrane protease activity